MAKDDSAIQNQKVFITLESVLNLQLDYAKAVVAKGAASESQSDTIKAHHRARVETFAEVIKTLKLPIRLQ